MTIIIVNARIVEHITIVYNGLSSEGTAQRFPGARMFPNYSMRFTKQNLGKIRIPGQLWYNISIS